MLTTTATLELELEDLDELLNAIGDREDLGSPEVRERLKRARQAVEAELSARFLLEGLTSDHTGHDFAIHVESSKPLSTLFEQRPPWEQAVAA